MTASWYGSSWDYYVNCSFSSEAEAQALFHQVIAAIEARGWVKTGSQGTLGGDEYSLTGANFTISVSSEPSEWSDDVYVYIYIYPTTAE